MFRFHNLIVLIFALIGFNGVTSLTAEARVATPEDVGSVIEFDRRRIDVKADGKYHFKAEYQIRITNESGRDQLSEQPLAYNAGASKLRVLAARVISPDGKVHDVPKTNIETRDVGENIKFFDQQKQVVISFPNVRIGSRLFVSYEIRFDEVPVPGQFSATYSASGANVDSMSMEIISDKPLHLWRNDPEESFAFEAEKTGKRFSYKARSVKPMVFAVADEEFHGVDPGRETMFAYSSVKLWSEYAPSIAKEIEGLTAAKLPTSLQKILSSVDRNVPVVDQLNRVTAMMSEDFRYFGDWRRRNGTHLPRTLEEIAASRYGDCKDLSLVAAALYRALGFKAYQAWIYRGNEPLNPLAYGLPTDQLFNHAVTYVEAGGKTFWVDPTNAVSFAQGVFIDIAERPAFVLNPANPSLVQTPSMNASESEWNTDIRLEVAKNGEVRGKGQVRASGRMAITMTTNNFFSSNESNDYWLVRAVSQSERAESFKVGEYERRSRIVGDLTIDIEYLLADIGLRTSAGFGFPLNRDWIVDAVLVDTRNRQSAIWLDAPRVSVQRYEIVNVKKVGGENLNCSIDSPWAVFSRKVQGTSRGVVVTDRVESRRRLIPFVDHQSPEFSQLQKKVRDCFYRSAVVLRSR